MTRNDPVPPPSPDDALMRRVAEDSTQALGELMAHWQPVVYRFIMRGVRDAGVAEELTQETFWRLWRARVDYRPGGRFSSWIFRIATRLCLDHYRSCKRRPMLVDEEAARQACAPQRDHADRGACEAELAAALDRALGLLPLNQRLALEMNHLEVMTYREIADALGCTVGSVEQLIFRARKRLRVELADFLPDYSAHPPRRNRPRA